MGVPKTFGTKHFKASLVVASCLLCLAAGTCDGATRAEDKTHACAPRHLAVPTRGFVMVPMVGADTPELRSSSTRRSEKVETPAKAQRRRERANPNSPYLPVALARTRFAERRANLRSLTRRDRKALDEAVRRVVSETPRARVTLMLSKAAAEALAEMADAQVNAGLGEGPLAQDAPAWRRLSRLVELSGAHNLLLKDLGLHELPSAGGSPLAELLPKGSILVAPGSAGAKDLPELNELLGSHGDALMQMPGWLSATQRSPADDARDEVRQALAPNILNDDREFPFSNELALWQYEVRELSLQFTQELAACESCGAQTRARTLALAGQLHTLEQLLAALPGDGC